jgi:hypothetical protein
MIGTPGYLSPEQAAGQPASAASDWYAVGVMVFVSLTGELPFRGKGLKVLLAKQERDAPTPGRWRPASRRTSRRCASTCCSATRASDPRRPRCCAGWATGPSGIRPRDAVRRDSGDLFLGRDAHLKALQDAFGATHRGRAVAVHVCGRSGMGKSALVREFLARLQRSDRAVTLVGAATSASRCRSRRSTAWSTRCVST